MKTITEIPGGAQALPDISFDIQTCFEEYLTDEYKTFLHLLRVTEEAFPSLIRPYAGTGRPPYPYTPFLQGALAKNYFGIDKTSSLIQRLKGEPNLRLLCGFDKVPSEATFSGMFAYLAERNIGESILDTPVKKACEGRVVYHNNRDSTAIPAREKPCKKEAEKTEKPKKKAGKAAQKYPDPPCRADRA
jgi:transposase